MKSDRKPGDLQLLYQHSLFQPGIPENIVHGRRQLFYRGKPDACMPLFGAETGPGDLAQLIGRERTGIFYIDGQRIILLKDSQKLYAGYIQANPVRLT